MIKIGEIWNIINSIVMITSYYYLIIYGIIPQEDCVLLSLLPSLVSKSSK